MYSDASCTYVASDTSLDSQAPSLSSCSAYQCEPGTWWDVCVHRYAVGGLGGPPAQDKKSAVVVYEDNWCTLSPIQLTITMSMQCIAPAAPVCDTLFPGANPVYQARECISSVNKYVDSKFQSTPYLVVENYAIGTNCQILNNATMYAADGKCHLNSTDGKYFTIIQDMDGSIIVASYPTSVCKESEALNSNIDSWYVNSDMRLGDQVFRTSKMALATTISAPKPTATPIPTQGPPTVTPSAEVATKIRLEIMFPAWLWDQSRQESLSAMVDVVTNFPLVFLSCALGLILDSILLVTLNHCKDAMCCRRVHHFVTS